MHHRQTDPTTITLVSTYVSAPLAVAFLSRGQEGANVYVPFNADCIGLVEPTSLGGPITTDHLYGLCVVQVGHEDGNADSVPVARVLAAGVDPKAVVHHETLCSSLDSVIRVLVAAKGLTKVRAPEGSPFADWHRSTKGRESTVVVSKFHLQRVPSTTEALIVRVPADEDGRPLGEWSHTARVIGPINGYPARVSFVGSTNANEASADRDAETNEEGGVDTSTDTDGGSHE